METQWRVSMAGPVGLDYMVAFALMELNDTPKAERRALLDDLKVMEAAAIERMTTKQ